MKLTLGIGTLAIGMLAFGYAYLPVHAANQGSPLCTGSCPVCPATQTAARNLNAGALIALDTPAATQPVDVGNKKCLIETKDDVVDGVTCTYEGKIYHFCCKDCIGTFKADPAKYIKDLAEHPEKYGIKK